MRVRKEFVGNGVYRLVVEPTMACENNVPTHAVETMVNDVIRREKGCCGVNPFPHMATRVCHEEPKPWFNRPEVKTFNSACTPQPRMNREPDGIDVHVDRPLRENFRTHHDWALAMAKYRTLEDVAKDCDWECREPMKGVNEPKCVKQTNPWCLSSHIRKPKVETKVILIKEPSEFDMLFDEDFWF